MTAEARRRQLVACAVEIAEESGFGALTMRDVAARAQVSLGTLQHFYPARDDLIRAVAVTIAEHVAELAGQLPADVMDMRGVEGLETLLTRALASLWDALSRDAGRRLVSFELVTAAVRTQGHLMQTVTTQYTMNEGYVAHVISAAGAVTGVDFAVPVAEIAKFVVAYLDGFEIRWLIDPDSIDTAAQHRMLVKAVMTFAVSS